MSSLTIDLNESQFGLEEYKEKYNSLKQSSETIQSAQALKLEVSSSIGRVDPPKKKLLEYLMLICVDV